MAIGQGAPAAAFAQARCVRSPYAVLDGFRSLGGGLVEVLLMAKTVAEIMNRELFTVSENETVGRVRRYLLALGIRSAPVVDREGRPRGFVSLLDLLRTPDEHHVHVPMTAPAQIVSPDASIEVAARQMAEHDCHHLVCVDQHERVIGFVGALDVIRGLVGEPMRYPPVFPHRDSAAPLHWSDQFWLRAGELDVAPDGPGVFVLISGQPGADDRVVWSEATKNVRQRLEELVENHRILPPHVAGLLGMGRLRARAAPAPSSRALAQEPSPSASPSTNA